MAEESWHEARLIPTSGISGAAEQERRATSALLAVMSSVTEFGRALTRPYGAPAGRVEAYVEVPFIVEDQKLFPDGLVRVTRGKRTWTALVEVKTGDQPLKAEQIENYLDIARIEGFDAVITISNEITPIAGQHPTVVDKRKLRRVALHHMSWTKVLSEAVMQKEFRGVADPDQAWILGELIRYLEHPRSGAMEFTNMGDAWVAVRDAVRTETLRANDRGVSEVAGRYDALLRFACLSLGRHLGTEVTPVLSRRELTDPGFRAQALVTELTTSGQLSGIIRIPATIGDITVTADLRARQIICYVDVGAPGEGRSRTRVSWLIKQLRSAPDTVRIEARAVHERGPGATELLQRVREDPTLLIADPSRELRSFRVALASSMGTKRGRGSGSFIDSVLTALDTFYAEVVQHLKAWRAAPPRLRTENDALAVEDGDIDPNLISTALSSQDDDKVGVGDAD